MERVKYYTSTIMKIKKACLPISEIYAVEHGFYKLIDVQYLCRECMWFCVIFQEVLRCDAAENKH